MGIALGVLMFQAMVAKTQLFSSMVQISIDFQLDQKRANGQMDRVEFSHFESMIGYINVYPWFSSVFS